MGSRLAILALLAATMGCASPEASWVVIEQYDQSAFYFDNATVKRMGNRVEFETVLASTNWIQVGGERAQIRTLYRLDCTARTYRSIRSGIYLDGQLESQSEGRVAGKIDQTSHMPKIERMVCPDRRPGLDPGPGYSQRSK